MGTDDTDAQPPAPPVPTAGPLVGAPPSSMDLLLTEIRRMGTSIAAMQTEMRASHDELAVERAARIAMEARIGEYMHPAGPSGTQQQLQPPPATPTVSITAPSVGQAGVAPLLTITGVGQRSLESSTPSPSAAAVPAGGATAWSSQLSAAQIAQQAMQRKPYDLPEFNGRPEQWPLFISAYRQSTLAFAYSDLQNVFRLQKCLKGDALEEVQALLMHPENLAQLIAALEFRFGRPEILVQDQMARLRDAPSINERQLEQIIPYSSRVQNLVAFLNTDASRHVLGETTLMAQLVGKLPMTKKLEWATYAQTILPRPTAVHFAEWLRRIAQCVSTIVSQPVPTSAAQAPDTRSGSSNPQRQRQDRRVLLNVVEAPPAFECAVCARPHRTADCGKLRRMTIAERWSSARQLRMCFACLRSGHSMGDCRDKRTCSIDGCDRQHHTMLHSIEPDAHAAPASQRRPIATSEVRGRRNNADRPNRTAATSQAVVPTRPPTPEHPSTGGRQNPFARRSSTVLTCRESPDELPLLFRIVPVVLRGPRTSTRTYALLDDGSALTLMDDELADQLRLPGPITNLNVHWIGDHASSEPSREVSVEIQGADDDDTRFRLVEVRTVRGLNLPMQSLAVSQTDPRHRHLRELPVPEYCNAEPKILIGLDNSDLGLASCTRTSECGGPIAAKTPLGWVVYGQQTSRRPARVLHCTEGDSRYERLERIVCDYFTTESFGVRHTGQALESDDDMRARIILQSTTACVGARYQTGLLWRSDDIRLPDSYQMALTRLRSVERKMRQDAAYADRYVQQMTSYFDKGYARKLSAREVQAQGGPVWYLPHFGHETIHKPGKLRIVFDAAAKVDGVSLNSALVKGPDLNQPLTTILYQFRMRPIGICADIAEMFCQVLIQPADRSAQRFLWRTDPQKPPDICEMQVMTFGATCSPTSAQYVKNRNADRFEEEFPAASEAIRALHYVDDFVASFMSEEEAARVTKEVVEIHRRGGFTLRGFVSNSGSVLRRLGENQERGREMCMELDSNATEKILGLRWCTLTDSFTFSMRFDKVDAAVMSGTRTPTKREILSATMSVFDPFGFVADYMLHAKLLIQSLWRTPTLWDQPVPDEVDRRWRSWCREIVRIKELSVPRCYSVHLTTADEVQLHIFADASLEAFAAVAYWRVVRGRQCDLAFVAGKTRCAPLKTLTTPRLELQAAILAVRLHNSICAGHTVNIARTTLWTDSMTVLSWIQSTHRRFPQYVSHRVGEILEETRASWWRWLPTNENVADDATRSSERPRYDPNSRWIRGPAFLREEETCWPVTRPVPVPRAGELLTEEVAPKFVGVVATGRVVDFTRFSSFNRIIRTAGWTMRFVENLRARTRGTGRRSGELDADELRNATDMLCRLAQLEAYPDEYAALLSGNEPGRTSSIRTLKPYVGDNGVIRLFGRTDAADVRHLPIDAQRPILLPTKHRLTEMLVAHHHAKMGHQLEDATICSVRQRFWAPHMRRLVRSAKERCQECRIRAARPHPPVAGQLPVDRLTPYVSAFTHTGLDYFGPVQVTIGRRKEKRWVALFTCLATRAVHMEVAEDLSTDACLVAIRNFMNIRGVPTRIRSDCGTNFVGADGVLRRAKDFLDVEAMQRELATRGIDWLFNCPANPEAGGVWERLVQSTKRVLAVTLKSIAPRPETLRSFVIEAANILNSRPLTHVPVGPEDLEPITPNHFLIGRTNSTTTPNEIDMRQLCQRTQWRVCLELRNQFWSRWVREYLPELTRRTKYYEDVGPIREGDLVLICDANESRGNWARGRVERAIAGTDGRVRLAEVRTNRGLVRRPVTKLAILDVIGEREARTGARDVGELSAPSNV